METLQSETFFQQTLSVSSRDIDVQNQCRPSAVLGLLQDVAIHAAIALHVSRAELLEQRNLFWMLARIWYRLERPLRFEEQVTIKTWHRGGKGATIYRDFDLYVGEEHIGESVSAWVLADYDTRKLARLSDIPQFQNTDGGRLCKDITLGKMRIPQAPPLLTRRMQYSDTDINGHVNNTRYADFACDAVDLHNRQLGEFVQELRIDYRAECRPGDELILHRSEDDGGTYIIGYGEEKPRFEVKLVMGKEE